MLDALVSAALRPFRGRLLTVRAGEAAGARLRLSSSSSVWATGTVEGPVQAALAQALRPGAVLHDVGASIGFYTVLGARLVGPGGRVVAFEPHPLTAAEARANVAANALANVVVVPAAVSDVVGRATLTPGPSRPTASLDAAPGRGAVTVATTTLDAFVAARPGPGAGRGQDRRRRDTSSRCSPACARSSGAAGRRWSASCTAPARRWSTPCRRTATGSSRWARAGRLTAGSTWWRRRTRSVDQVPIDR